MTQKPIYLCYQTDCWHSNSSRVLRYIGEDKEDCIASLQAHRGMTDEQAEQVRNQDQSSSCEGNANEWLFERVLTNAFCD